METQETGETKIFGYRPAKLAVLILLLIILFYVVRNGNKPENFRGISYSAGATQRFQQELTATNQGPYETGYNFTVLSAMPGVSDKRMDPSAIERMTSGTNITHQNKPPLKQEEILAAQLYSEHMSASPDDVVKREINAAQEFSA